MICTTSCALSTDLSLLIRTRSSITMLGLPVSIEQLLLFSSLEMLQWCALHMRITSRMRRRNCPTPSIRDPRPRPWLRERSRIRRRKTNLSALMRTGRMSTTLLISHDPFTAKEQLQRLLLLFIEMLLPWFRDASSCHIQAWPRLLLLQRERRFCSSLGLCLMVN